MASTTGVEQAQGNEPTIVDTSERVEVRNPALGSVAGHVPNMSPAELAATLRAAQPEWEALGPRGRARHLLAWLDWLMDHDEHVLGLVRSESGKSWGDTSIETTVAVEVINYYARNAGRFLADRTRHPHGPASWTKKLKLHQHPCQLVGVLTPWNYPLAMPMMDVPPALMAGAAVLTKPSEVAPLARAEMVRA